MESRLSRRCSGHCKRCKLWMNQKCRDEKTHWPRRAGRGHEWREAIHTRSHVCLSKYIKWYGVFYHPAAEFAGGSRRNSTSSRNKSCRAQVWGQMAERSGNRAINQKIAGSIPGREKLHCVLGQGTSPYLPQGECPCTYCKSLWIRASAKWLNVSRARHFAAIYGALQPVCPWHTVGLLLYELKITPKVLQCKTRSTTVNCFSANLHHNPSKELSWLLFVDQLKSQTLLEDLPTPLKCITEVTLIIYSIPQYLTIYELLIFLYFQELQPQDTWSGKTHLHQGFF